MGGDRQNWDRKVGKILFNQRAGWDLGIGRKIGRFRGKGTVRSYIS
jgi:hypothetical protein